jgi:hypothetical protein
MALAVITLEIMAAISDIWRKSSLPEGREMYMFFGFFCSKWPLLGIWFARQHREKHGTYNFSLTGLLIAIAPLITLIWYGIMVGARRFSGKTYAYDRWLKSFDSDWSGDKATWLWRPWTFPEDCSYTVGGKLYVAGHRRIRSHPDLAQLYCL